jgi:hypothetical protein
MLRSLRSRPGRPPRNWNSRRSPRRLGVEDLEDRTCPSITFSGPGNTGVATLTGTSGNDQFVIQLKPGGPAAIEFSDNGGSTFTDASLLNITQINVNGLAGNDILVLNLANVPASGGSGNVPLTFDGGTGIDRFVVTGNTSANIYQTFTASPISSHDATLQVTAGAATVTATLTNVSGVLDTVTTAILTINGNDSPNVIQIGPGPTVPGVQTNEVRGLDINSLAAPDQRGEDDAYNFDLNISDGADKADFSGRGFMPIAFGNATDVTINGQGGDDLFLATATAAPTGLQNLTLDGGTGFNVLLANSQGTGVNVGLNNIQSVRTTPVDIFISKLFAQRLGCNASDAQVSQFASILSRDGPAAFVREFEESLQVREFLVNGWYLKYLGRQASDAEAQAWANAMFNGMTEEQGLEAILSSNEFFQRAQPLFNTGDANQNFILALYQEVLNRAPSSDEVNGWMQALPGLGRATVALDIVMSAEFRFNFAGALYGNLLHRGASQVEMGVWAFSGLNLLQIREAFLGSTEFQSS